MREFVDYNPSIADRSYPKEDVQLVLSVFDWIRLSSLMDGNQPILTQSKKSLGKCPLSVSPSVL